MGARYDPLQGVAGVSLSSGVRIMHIEIQRNETSQPIIYDAINAYTKGPMYCVLLEKDGKRVTHKYPLCSIFRVIEDYLLSKRP